MRSFRVADRRGILHQYEFIYGHDDFLGQVRRYRNLTLVEDRRIVRDGKLAIQERDAANTLLREYTWGLNLGGGIGGLLVMRQSGQEYHYLYGGKGNVSAVIDSTQTVVTSYRYDSFGRLTTQSGTLDQPYRFSTKQYLADIGLNYYGYRFYSPAMGRWLNRDPLGEAGGLNLYAFIQNNPTNVVDPNGLNPAMCEFAADFTTGFLAPGPPPPTWGGAAGYAAREMVNGMGIDVDAVLDSLPDILADMWEAYYKQNFNPNWRFDYYGPYYPGAKYAPGEYYWESRDNYECRRNAENRVLLRAK